MAFYSVGGSSVSCGKCTKQSGNATRTHAFCEDCSNNLCKSCYDIHRRFSVTKGHRLYVYQNRKHPLCRNYEDKTLDLVCFDHFDLFFEKDLNKHNKKCNAGSMEYTSKVSKSELDSLKRKVREKKETILEAKEHKRNDIIGQKENVLKQIGEYWKSIMIKIKQCKRRTKRDVNNVFEKEDERINYVTSKALGELEKLEMSLTKMQENVNQKDSYYVISDRILNVSEIISKLYEPAKPFKTPDYLISFEKYVRNLNCMSFRSTGDTVDIIDVLGETSLDDTLDLEIDSGSCDLDIENGSLSVDDIVRMEEKVNTLKNIQITTAKRRESLNIKMLIDKDDCCITGLSICNDGNLLLVDCYNRKLKLVSTSGECISSVETPGEPFDVSATNTEEAAVSMWMNQKEILLYGLTSNSMHMKSVIKLRNRIYGISAVGDDFAISCDDKIPSVRLVNRAGETKWSLSFSSDGRKIFKSPSYVITHSVDQVPYVLVSDTETHTIVVIEATSGTIFNIIPQNTVGPLGLAPDSYGNIYVGYCYKAGIRIWSPTMNQGKLLLSSEDNIKRPQAVAFNTLTNELFISSWRCNEIECFQIHNI